jgi:hypothetical protein
VLHPCHSDEISLNQLIGNKIHGETLKKIFIKNKKAAHKCPIKRGFSLSD